MTLDFHASTPSVVEGLLLAGGRSRRMGREKALLPAPSGEPLWSHQWAKLGEVAGLARRRLAVRAEQAWVPAEVERVLDTEPEGGVLPALRAAALTCQGTHLLVLAVDMPAVPGIWLRRLMDACRPGLGAVGAHPGGDWPYEPLAAVYPRIWLEQIGSELPASQKALQPWVAAGIEAGRLQPLAITPDTAGWFANWNVPGDLLK